LAEILYEDPSLIAFDKPGGLLVAPDRWEKDAENLMDWIHARLSPGIFNAHRLDRDTSGIVLCARNKATLTALCRAFEEHHVSKRYVALVRGNPSWTEQAVALALAPDESQPGRMKTVRRGGKPAATRLRVLQSWTGYALVEAVPETGRTHQIRVHLAAVGHPIVADPLYGDGRALLLSRLKRRYKQKPGETERPLMARTALHAERLALRHPDGGHDLTIQAPLPHDIRLAMKYLDRFAG
jgi:RluA family pseudouridine synthase